MKKVTVMILLILLTVFGCHNPGNPINALEPGTVNKIADHTIVDRLWNGEIPEADIQRAKDVLQIGYGHTSHGSQLSTGMTALVAFANGGNLGGTAYSHDLFAFSATGIEGTLHLFEGAGYNSGWLELDAGYYPSWKEETEEFLEEAAHSGCNVIMWSWCGQVSNITEQEMIDRYLTPMSDFELEYPDITFVYMTGHLDGTGETGNLHLRNEQIRAYCEANGKWLYDFADIESYDPDGNYYLDKAANDECYYDSTGDGTRDSNWAVAWQTSHVSGTDWFPCSPAHTQALNGNMKAYAAWWLFARIAAQM